jgi:hypothetical protein
VSDELRDEYQFDYRQAKPNRFATGVKKGGRLVVLDPEVAAAFPRSEEVNAALRGLLQSKNGRRAPMAPAESDVPQTGGD